MTKHSDRKEVERAEYAQEHTIKISHAEEISSLKAENEKLKKKIKKLKKQVCKEEYVPFTDEMLAPFKE
jgi:cell division protein FtsB